MDLKKVWMAELEILSQIDVFCREHGLKYSLAYGTMIGAVRHGGFIPWDDDIDIIMPRADYEFLISNWNVQGFIVQNKRTNDDYSQNFTKIRKDNTAFLQEEYERYVSYHTGIFVDIFPGDRIAPKGILRKLQFFYCALNLLYSREHISGGKSSVIEKVLLMVPHKIRVRIANYMEKSIQKWNTSRNPFFFPSTIEDAGIYYDSDLFDQMIDIEFAGQKCMCVTKYDKFLRRRYGDYMQLPPEEERVLKHHPIVVDMHHNYIKRV